MCQEGALEHGCDYAPVAGKQLYKQKCLELLKGALDIRNQTDHKRHPVKAGGKTDNNKKKALFRIVYILLSIKNLIEKLLKIPKIRFLTKTIA